mgnify:CR=1 FL=1
MGRDGFQIYSFNNIIKIVKYSVIPNGLNFKKVSARTSEHLRDSLRGLQAVEAGIYERNVDAVASELLDGVSNSLIELLLELLDVLAHSIVERRLRDHLQNNRGEE